MTSANKNNPPDIDAIRRDLQSADTEVLGRALRELLKLVPHDKGIHAEALGVFQKWAAAAPDFYVAIQSAKGIRQIAGEDAFREVWHRLLEHPSESVVMNVVGSTDDPSWVPVLIEMLDRRTETSIRQSLLLCLGKLKDRSALPALVKCLANENTKGYAAVALGQLGDPQAIPHLDPFLNDKTPLWPVDNHGPTERMCDVASAAIRQLQQRGTPDAADAAAPMRAATQPVARPPRRTHWIAFAPLACVAMSAVIFFILSIQVLEKHGHSGYSAQQSRRMDLIITCPGIFGLLLGAAALSRFARLTVFERIACILGILICVPVARSFFLLALR